MDLIEETTRHLPIVGRTYRTAKFLVKYGLVFAAGAATMWAGYYSWNNFVPADTRQKICRAVGFSELEEKIAKEVDKKINSTPENPNGPTDSAKDKTKDEKKILSLSIAYNEYD